MNTSPTDPEYEQITNLQRSGTFSVITNRLKNQFSYTFAPC